MKKLLFIAISFFLLNSFSIEKDERIEWREDRKLTWADFKGAPDEDTPYAAITASGLYHEFSGKIRAGKVTYNSKVVCYFHPQDSWYKKEMASENLLAHEQLHFDISELHARQLRKAIQAFNFTKNMQSEMDALYKKANSDMKAMQTRYDNEVDFSLNKEQQKAWQIKIQKELQRLVAYK
ncbi:DUF922 domain-containing protein [Sungkyunkwania multivorans]|uniref:DUF922 domain-containing protein n=1 Tax=Sungkyunkwania multivorans TaxID=1173618 RepID=A0ABW3CW22_9FLAO